MQYAPVANSTGSARSDWRRLFRRLAYVVFALSVLCDGLWIERGHVLRYIADAWVVSDAISPAAAAVVLGGDLDVRPFAAASLYKQGLVKQILISQVNDKYPAVTIGVVPRHTDAGFQILLKLGVPAGAIETFGTENTNTKDEAFALSAWAVVHHPAALIIPMDIFGARRVRWIFDRAFSGQQVRIEVPSYDSPDYSTKNWWHDDKAIVAFQNEVIKYLYYRVKY
jgi:hypothetical protein